MKTNVILLTAVMAFLMISCGGGSKEIAVKNNSTEFTGALRDYLEVVDGDYSISDVGYDVILTAKFKVINSWKMETYLVPYVLRYLMRAECQFQVPTLL